MSPVLRQGVRDFAFALFALVIVGAVFLLIDAKLTSLLIISAAVLLGMALRIGWREFQYGRDVSAAEQPDNEDIEH